MTAKQYGEALKRLALTQGAAAEMIGVSIRTSNGYANGEPIPEPVARLLRLVLRLNVSPGDVR